MGHIRIVLLKPFDNLYGTKKKTIVFVGGVRARRRVVFQQVAGYQGRAVQL